jgi:hypothetical protein
LTGTLGALTVLTLYGVVKRCAPDERGLAWLAAIFLALDLNAVVYSRFGFSYNLLAPLTLIFVLGLWRYWEMRSAGGLALAAAVLGLGTLSDLWMGVLAAPMLVVMMLRRRRDAAWTLPLAALPFGLYALVNLLFMPDAFLFDLRYTLGRLNAIPLDQQIAVLAENAVTLACQYPLLASGALGLLFLRPGGLRVVCGLTFSLAFALLGRTTALFSLGFYYLIPLLPLAALGLAALAVRGWEWTARWPLLRLALALGLTAALMLSAADTLRHTLSGGSAAGGAQGMRAGFATPIDDFLVKPDDARAAAAFVNARVRGDDVVIASPAVAWLLTGRAADFQMAVAATGRTAVHIPGDLPAERWAFDPRFDLARYVVADPLWRNWAAIHISEVDAQLRAMDNWPTAFRAGDVVVYRNPAIQEIP